MKLLDLPPDLPKGMVTFHPKGWDEFDRVVTWLVKEGVPLRHGSHMVSIAKKGPIAAGKLLTYSLGGQDISWVNGEEINVEYCVYMPRFIR